MRRARIIGTGAYLPEEIITNHDLEALMDTSDEWIRKRTGIEERHRAAPGEGTSDMALHAAKQALENAGVAPEELDAVLLSTLSPDQLFPASGNLLQGKLGAVNAASCDINAACSGFIYGLATAKSFIETGLHDTVLLVGADLSTSFLTFKHRDTDVLFADGAGAVVLRAEEGDHGVISMYLGSDGANYEILSMPMAGSKYRLTPENINDDPWKITMDGREVFKRAIIKFGESIKIALDSTGLSLDDIALFVPHQANARITEAVCERLDFPRERVVSNINKVGNTIAASIPIALHEANAAGRIKEGDLVLIAAFGAGLTWGSSIIRW